MNVVVLEKFNGFDRRYRRDFTPCRAFHSEHADKQHGIPGFGLRLADVLVARNLPALGCMFRANRSKENVVAFDGVGLDLHREHHAPFVKSLGVVLADVIGD